MSIEKFTEALISLMPKGITWNYDSGTNMRLFLQSLASEFAEVDDASLALLEEADPRTAEQTLDSFERLLNIKNTSDDEEQRRGEIVRRMQSLSAVTEEEFLKIVKNYAQTSQVFQDLSSIIEAVDPDEIILSRQSIFQCGSSACGDAIGGEEFIHVIYVNINASQPIGEQGTVVRGNHELSAFLQAQEYAVLRFVV